jgi:hypothetical protein
LQPRDIRTLPSTVPPQVHRDLDQPTVFAISVDNGERNRLFRAPSEMARDKWVAALVTSMSHVPLGSVQALSSSGGMAGAQRPTMR